MDTVDTRTCKRCGEVRPLDQFSPVKKCKGGRRPICTPCRSEVERARRAADPERYREYDRERHKNPTRRAQTIAASHRAYNRDREAALAARRAHYQENKEKWEVYRARRHARTKGIRFSAYTRREIYDRDQGICRGCKKFLPFAKGAFHIDHIVPVELGGPSTPANLQLMCPTCNRKKWNKLEGQIHLPV